LTMVGIHPTHTITSPLNQSLDRNTIIPKVKGDTIGYFRRSCYGPQYSVIRINHSMLINILNDEVSWFCPRYRRIRSNMFFISKDPDVFIQESRSLGIPREPLPWHAYRRLVKLIDFIAGKG